MNVLFLLTLIHGIVSIIVLPAVLSLVGTTLAAALAQDKWPKEVNATIAWAVLILAAFANADIAGLIDGDPWHILAAMSGFTTLLVAGGLASLKPYLLWLDIVQKTIFNLAGPIEDKSAARLSTSTPPDVVIVPPEPVQQQPPAA